MLQPSVSGYPRLCFLILYRSASRPIRSMRAASDWFPPLRASASAIRCRSCSSKLCGDGLSCVDRTGGVRRTYQVVRQIADVDHFAGRHHARVADDVLQFAHIAGPVVPRQR